MIIYFKQFLGICDIDDCCVCEASVGTKLIAQVQVVVFDDRLGAGEPYLLRRIEERKTELKSGTWCLRVHGERSEQTELSLMMDAVDSVSQINQVLGFVDYCTHEKDMTGKEVQRQVELMKVFFGIHRVGGDLSF